MGVARITVKDSAAPADIPLSRRLMAMSFSILRAFRALNAGKRRVPEIRIELYSGPQRSAARVTAIDVSRASRSLGFFGGFLDQIARASSSFGSASFG